MKLAVLVMGALLFMSPAFGAPAGDSKITGTYNLYLYFGDSKPHLDEMTLELDENGKLRGQMHVPNDFDAELEIKEFIDKIGLPLDGDRLSFEVRLPEKYHQTLDYFLVYELGFLSRFTLDNSQQLVGFVTAYKKSGFAPNYVGSVVGFRKKP